MKKEKLVNIPMNRRSFLKIAGYAAGGTILGSAALPPVGVSIAKSKAGGELKAGIVGVAKIATFDPAHIDDICNWQVTWAIYNSLVKFDGDMNILPDLAKSWENPDANTYIFHLRQGVMFHDGNECTAEDVKFTLERIMDPSTGAREASKFSEIEDIMAKDKYTVIIRMKRPFAPLLCYLTNTRTASQIVSRKAVQQYGKDFGAHPVGTGPFKFVEFRPGAYLALEKFKNYFKKGLPHIDKLVFPLIPEDVTGVSALLAGDIHAVNAVPPTMVKQVEQEKGVSFYRKPGLNLRNIMFNLKQKPFDDIYVRQAFAHAINKKELIDIIYNGNGAESVGPIPPAIKWAYDPNFKGRTFNPEKAKALLSKSRYSKKEINDISIHVEGFGTGWWKRFAEFASYQISQVLGIELKIRISEYGSLYERIKSGNVSMVPFGFLGPVEVDEYLYQLYHTKGTYNEMTSKNYSNKEVDRILEMGREVINLDERAKLYRKAQEIIVEESPDIFCFHADILQAVRANVKGFVQTPYNGYGAQFEDVWVE